MDSIPSFRQVSQDKFPEQAPPAIMLGSDSETRILWLTGVFGSSAFCPPAAAGACSLPAVGWTSLLDATDESFALGAPEEADDNSWLKVFSTFCVVEHGLSRYSTLPFELRHL